VITYDLYDDCVKEIVICYTHIILDNGHWTYFIVIVVLVIVPGSQISIWMNSFNEEAGLGIPSQAWEYPPPFLSVVTQREPN